MSLRNQIIILISLMYLFGCCSENKNCDCQKQSTQLIKEGINDSQLKQHPENRSRLEEELAEIKKMLTRELCENHPHKLFGAISYRELSFKELYDLNCWQLKVLRNVPYASHGLKFQELDLRLFFENCTNLNRARAEDSRKVVAKISRLEWRNIEKIQQVENYFNCSDGLAYEE